MGLICLFYINVFYFYFYKNSIFLCYLIKYVSLYEWGLLNRWF